MPERKFDECSSTFLESLFRFLEYRQPFSNLLFFSIFIICFGFEIGNGEACRFEPSAGRTD